MINPKPKILVIDDEPEVVALVKEYLEGYEYKIITAKDGPEGFKQASLQKPDLILLDIIMPAVDGLTILRKLRAGDDTRRMPVILLTAKNRVDDILEAKQYGATDYIVKPFKLAELLKFVQKYLAIYGAQ